MTGGRGETILLWLAGLDGGREVPAQDELWEGLASLGLSGPLAGAVLERFRAELYLQRRAGEEPSPRAALRQAVWAIAQAVPELAWAEAVGAGAPLGIRELDPVTVDEQGAVHRGRSDEGIGGSRPHIYIWFDPSDDGDCEEYFWYQFARPRLLVDGEEETDEVRRFSYETSGGATMKMGEWRADFIQEGVDRMDAARQDSGKSELPEFEPPGLKRSPLSSKKPKGKPYIGPSIPGHAGEGVVDAPNLCYRGPNPTERTISNLSRVYREYLRDVTRQAQQRPQGGSHSVTLVIEFRTYLVCIDPPPECVGYVEWTYTTRATMDYEWRPTEANHVGVGPRRWRRWPTRRSDCTFEVTIGDFRDC